MREYWLCKLFGHKFVGRFSEGNYIIKRKVNECVKCGLSKKEIK